MALKVTDYQYGRLS